METKKKKTERQEGKRKKEDLTKGSKTEGKTENRTDTASQHWEFLKNNQLENNN
jgi:hypothetical protein